MKVIFSHPHPFALAHGGSQVLIESLMTALRSLGVEVEPERWWDADQSGDILHYVGRPQELNVQLAKAKGLKIVMTELLDKTASRNRLQLWLQRQMIGLGTKLLSPLVGRLGWNVYKQIDAIVYVVPLEWEVAQYLFRAPQDRGRIIGHGLAEGSLLALKARNKEEDYLISVGTIHPRKNTLLLARAAQEAGIPVLFLGKPYSETDGYFLAFKKCVDGSNVRFGGFVSDADKHRYLTGARGFVHLSEFESGCISVYEAAAAGLPLLLSNAPWATTSLQHSKHICFTNVKSVNSVARSLETFYQSAHRQPAPTFPVRSWVDVASEYKMLYEEVLNMPAANSKHQAGAIQESQDHMRQE